MMIPSGSQTVGPFFNFGLTANKELGRLVRNDVRGERIRVEFRVTDGDGEPTPGDSMIELWQADAQGRYHGGLDFDGFGRLETNAAGECAFETIKPGSVDGQAPHINVVVFARGLLKQLHTRLYFAGEPLNATDQALALVPEDRRASLLAQPVPDKPGTWRMEIRLQGEAETVFFDV